MNFLKKLSICIIAVSACILCADGGACAAAPAQTQLNPAAPRKSPYPRIVIYTVSWCPHCRELKEYLTARNIPFINRDVELDAAAMEDIVQKYKSTGVPIVVIGNDSEVLKGFSGEEFEKAVAKVRAGGR